MYKSNLAELEYQTKHSKDQPIGNVGFPDQEGNLIVIPGLILPWEFYQKIKPKK